MTRRVKTLHMGVSEANPLFGGSYDMEVKNQRPNYDAPPYNRWPDGHYYKPFEDSGLVYDPDSLPFHVNEMPQLRTSYDPDKIEDLAERVKTPEEKPPYVKLEQAVRIAEFDNREAFQQFLSDFQLFHKLEHPIDVDYFDPEPNGKIRILDYGHRRCRAMRIATKEYHYTLLNCDVKKEIIPNPTFESFIDSQSRENEHHRPSPEDEAWDIRKRFEFYKVKHDGEPPTKAWLARRMGCGANKVTDALRFTELPKSVMDWFDSKVINYDIAVECWRLREVGRKYYAEKYPHKYPVGGGELEKATEALVLAELSLFAKSHMQGASYDSKLKVIKAKINSLSATTQDTVFDDSLWTDPVEHHKTAGVAMGKYAISVLEFRLRDVEVTDTELAALEGLAARARQRQAERAAVLEAAQEAAEAAASYQETQQLFDVVD